MLKPITHLNQFGDTIIEVMIAIIILSGILGGTFAIASRSQKTTEANHERYQAQLYVNQQAEWIRSAAASDRAAFISKFSADQTFCMNNATVVANETSATCTKDGLYKIVITASKNCNYITSACAQDTYNDFYIRVYWDSLVTNGNDEVDMVYGI